MKIRILELISGAGQAGGLTVIIDVFRAFSLEAYMFHSGAREIYAVGSEQTARALKAQHPEYILVGERGGRILPGFDYGNSPFQTARADFRGQRIIHTTSSGTQGLVNATGAEELLTGSLVNAKAIAAYIRQKSPREVSLVAMGRSGVTSTPEDVLCARYIRSLLENHPLQMAEEIEKLRHTEEAQKFFRPSTQEIFPEEDYHLCTACDSLNLVLKAQKVNEDIFRVIPCGELKR